MIMLATWVGTGRALKALGIGSVCVIPPHRSRSPTFATISWHRAEHCSPQGKNTMPVEVKLGNVEVVSDCTAIFMRPD